MIMPSPKCSASGAQINSVGSVHAKDNPVFPEPVDKSPSDATKKTTAGDGQVFDVLVKRMIGELSVSVLCDRSHRLFPGLKTKVLFTLTG